LYPRVYNFFRFRLHDDALAEDLTATTFERAWRHRANFQEERGEFAAWLFGIARRVAAEHWRRHRETVPLEDVAPFLEAGGAETRPEREAQRRQDEAALWRLLRELPSREQELIALKYGADMTNRAIAQLTGLSESNVGTILHRVVTRLHAAWERGE
jgi:RNA polymerase sigma-70 factor (ECF subfamily)